MVGSSVADPPPPAADILRLHVLGLSHNPYAHGACRSRAGTALPAASQRTQLGLLWSTACMPYRLILTSCDCLETQCLLAAELQKSRSLRSWPTLLESLIFRVLAAAARPMKKLPSMLDARSGK